VKRDFPLATHYVSRIMGLPKSDQSALPAQSCLAAAAVTKKRTFSALGRGTGQIGRQ